MLVALFSDRKHFNGEFGPKVLPYHNLERRRYLKRKSQN
jgi:hypothetical protein